MVWVDLVLFPHVSVHGHWGCRTSSFVPPPPPWVIGARSPPYPAHGTGRLRSVAHTWPSEGPPGGDASLPGGCGRRANHGCGWRGGRRSDSRGLARSGVHIAVQSWVAASAVGQGGGKLPPAWRFRILRTRIIAEHPLEDFAGVRSLSEGLVVGAPLGGAVLWRPRGALWGKRSGSGSTHPRSSGLGSEVEAW